jgi:hypothetical protein
MRSYLLSFTTICSITCLILGFWSIGDISLPSILKNELYSVIFYKEWYRILTATLLSEGVIRQVLEIALFYSEAIEYEMPNLHIKAMVNFLWKNILINIIVVGMEASFYYKRWEVIAWGNSGLMAITLTYITSRALREPFKKEKAFFLSYPVNNILYLITILSINWVFNSGLSLANIVAVSISVIEYLLLSVFDENKQALRAGYGNVEKEKELEMIKDDDSV